MLFEGAKVQIIIELPRGNLLFIVEII